MSPADAARAIDHATIAAEAVRALNHLTLQIGAHDPGGYREAADVDEVLGQLAVTAHRLCQALAQAERWLRHEHRAGRVRHDLCPDATGPITVLSSELRYARAMSAHLAMSLDKARLISTHLGTVQG